MLVISIVFYTQWQQNTQALVPFSGAHAPLGWVLTQKAAGSQTLK